MTVAAQRQADGSVRVEMSFEVVWDLVGRKKQGGLTSQLRSHPVPRPVKMMLTTFARRFCADLSLEKIFKTSLPAPFPPSSSSLLTLELPEWQGLEGKDFTLEPVLNFVERTTVGDVDRVTWDLKSGALAARCWSPLCPALAVHLLMLCLTPPFHSWPRL